MKKIFMLYAAVNCVALFGGDLRIHQTLKADGAQRDLFDAILRDKNDLVIQAIRNGADVNQVMVVPGNRKKTPLLLAADLHCVAWRRAEAPLEYEISAIGQGKIFMTLVENGAEGGEAINLLRTCGAPSLRKAYDEFRIKERTAIPASVKQEMLFEAIKRNNLNGVLRAIDLGANVQEPMNGQTALKLAANLHYQAWRATAWHGRPPMEYGGPDQPQVGFHQIYKTLLEEGADPYAQETDGETVAEFAFRVGTPGLTKPLKPYARKLPPPIPSSRTARAGA